MLFGLLTLYSAGQTDVPTHAAGRVVPAVLLVRHRRGGRLGGVPRLAPAARVARAGALRIQPGAAGAWCWSSAPGRARRRAAIAGSRSAATRSASRPSWPRWPRCSCWRGISRAGRSRPRSLRDLLMPGLIVGVPFLLVLKQPDLGSAIVFIGIAFAMLFWAGVRPRLLFMVASPGLSLLLAFNNWTWGAWMVAFTALLVLWRPYIYDSLVVLVPQRGDGNHRAPALAAARALSAEPSAHVPQSRSRSAGRRVPRHPVARGHRVRRLVRHRLYPGPAEAAGVPAGAAHRLRVPGRRRGARASSA